MSNVGASQAHTAVVRTAVAAPRRLLLVPRAAYRAPRAPFIGMVVALLAAALLGLLVLNTQIAQNSFTVAALQQRNQQLDDQQEALQQQVDSQAASNTLAAHASKLGMVPAGQPAFIRLPDGKVLGHPEPAVKPPTINIRGVGPGHAPGATDPSGNTSAHPHSSAQPSPAAGPQTVTSSSGGNR